MSIEALLLVYGLVVVAILVSYRNQLGLERETLISSVRATVQLLVMGFLLVTLFKLEHPAWWVLILLVMCGAAGVISGNRGKEVPHSHAISFLGIFAGSMLTFLVFVAAGVIKPEARFVIPVGGMIIGNSMKGASLALNRLIGELKHQSARIETMLALGGNATQAGRESMREAVRAAMIPTIDGMKVIGLVHLPGIMTGFILAGGSPLEAVKYQLAILFMLVGTTGLTCVIVTLLAVRRCFTPQLQLREQFRSSSNV